VIGFSAVQVVLLLLLLLLVVVVVVVAVFPVGENTINVLADHRNVSLQLPINYVTILVCQICMHPVSNSDGACLSDH
jgi:hypothetical protein